MRVLVCVDVSFFAAVDAAGVFDDQEDFVEPGIRRATLPAWRLPPVRDNEVMAGDERSGLGEYLRHHRSEMAPRNRPGASPLSHRRVPGLRRQELADIAGISVEYYTRLEQGRASRPSREILTALARAFQLSNAERDHLFRLADERTPRPPAPAADIRPGLRHLLDSLDDTMPVTIHDGRLDMLAFNVAAAELFGPVFDDGPYGHNIVHQAFTSAGLREVLGNEGAEQLSRVAAAELRKALGLYPEDKRLRSLFRELSASGTEFGRQWERGEIGTWRSAMKRVNHPTKGLLAFDSEMLHDPENDHWVMLFTPRRA
ncbi:helix-turn-helix domain-containing protein [Streptomyces uncialis]|uniref:helix-turn-helix domain-containing protein n=1 Tax=Streptomyces uncialis TaxID=1048205 RepID=UPI0037B015C7